MTIKIKARLPKGSGLVVLDEVLSRPDLPPATLAVVRLSRSSLLWDDEKEEWVATLSISAIEPATTEPDSALLADFLSRGRASRTGEQELEISEPPLSAEPVDFDTPLALDAQGFPQGEQWTDDLFVEPPKRSHKKKVTE